MRVETQVEPVATGVWSTTDSPQLSSSASTVSSNIGSEIRGMVRLQQVGGDPHLDPEPTLQQWRTGPGELARAGWGSVPDRRDRALP